MIYAYGSEKIEVPLYAIITAPGLSILFICIASCFVGNIQTIFTILSLAMAFTNIGLIYMAWNNKTLTLIIAFGELIIFAVALHVYSPKEVVNKVEHKIEHI